MASNGLILLEMIKNNPYEPKLLFLRKLLYFEKIFRKISRIFDGVGIFKGLKTHVPRFSQIKTWYQNVRKEANFKMSNIKLLGDDRPELYGHFSQKNVEINAT